MYNAVTEGDEVQDNPMLIHYAPDNKTMHRSGLAAFRRFAFGIVPPRSLATRLRCPVNADVIRTEITQTRTDDLA